MPSLAWNGNYRGPKALGSADFGTAWGTVGTAFQTAGARSIGAFIDVTVNDSQDMRFRLQGQRTASGSAYSLPISGVSNDRVSVQPEYFELAQDADQLVLLGWELGGVVPYSRLQIQVSSAGSTAAEINRIDLMSAI